MPSTRTSADYSLAVLTPLEPAIWWTRTGSGCRLRCARTGRKDVISPREDLKPFTCPLS
jgi:hypothetical protein